MYIENNGWWLWSGWVQGQGGEEEEGEREVQREWVSESIEAHRWGEGGEGGGGCEIVNNKQEAPVNKGIKRGAHRVMMMTIITIITIEGVVYMYTYVSRYI